MGPMLQFLLPIHSLALRNLHIRCNAERENHDTAFEEIAKAA